MRMGLRRVCGAAGWSGAAIGSGAPTGNIVLKLQSLGENEEATFRCVLRQC